MSMHRTHDLLVKQRTQLINMIRGLLAEFRVDIPLFTSLDNALTSDRTLCGNTFQPTAFTRIMSAAFSAIMMVGALVLLPVTVGMIEASMTRSASMP
jgi:hypothetical protein